MSTPFDTDGFDQPRWLGALEKFISYMRIDSKEATAVDARGAELDMWNSQRMFLSNVAAGLAEGQRTFYALKARQLGVTTISLAVDIFWLAMFPGLQGALVVDNDTNRDKFRLVIRRYIQSFPTKFFGSSFGIVKGKDNKSFMHFTNGSNLDFLVAGKSKDTWGESRAYNFAHLTEVAKYGKKEGLDSFREALAEHHPNRLYIYESTAYGYNFWRDMYIEAGRDRHTIRRMFLGWWAKELNSIPRKDKRFSMYGERELDDYERQMTEIVKERYGYEITQEQWAWYRWRSSDTSTADQTIKQNLPTTEDEAFQMSGYSFFQTRSLQKDLDRIWANGEFENEQPVLFQGYRYWLGENFFAMKCEQILDEERLGEVQLRVWEEPIKDAQYVIGVDPAYGRNDWGDRHCVSVWRCYADKLVQVAEYADNNVETRQCAWVTAHLAGAYRNCMVNIELGGPGRAVFTTFQDLRNQLRAEIYSKDIDDFAWNDAMETARYYLYHRPDSMTSGYAYHTQASHQITHEMLNKMRDAYSSNMLLIRSAPLVEEMLVVVQDGPHIGAPNRTKDDRVFAAALAHKAWDDWIKTPMIHNGYTYEMATKKEKGELSEGAVIIDRMVVDFFKRAEERAQEGPPSSFLSDRGLDIE